MLRSKRSVPERIVQPDPSRDNPLHHLQSEFVTWTLVIGLSEQTALIRRTALGYFIRWCDRRGINEPSQVTREVLEDYQADLYQYRKANGEPLALNTQATRLHPIRAFFKWLSRERRIPANPALEIVMPKLPRRLPRRIPSVVEIGRILAAPQTGTAAGIRDRAILELLYSSALRRMELVRLQVFDVDVEGATVLVRGGKGGADRMVPLGGRAARWVTTYVREVRPVLLAGTTGSSTLFLTDYGEPFAKNRLGDLVRRYLNVPRMRMPGACHLFRHACATHMLENGADIRFIQAMLGHADLSTTQIYTQVAITKLREVHSATHPAGLRRTLKSVDMSKTLAGGLAASGKSLRP